MSGSEMAEWGLPWQGPPGKSSTMVSRRWICLAVGLWLLGAQAGGLPRVSGQTQTPPATPTLAQRLTDLIEDHEGEVAVAVEHLETHEQFVYRADEPMPTASLIKFPIMIEAYRQAEAGLLDFDQMLELKPSDKVPGAGILTPHFSVGSRFAVRDAVRLMIAFSDNTATNLVIDQIGLPATSRAMEELGCPETRLNSKVYLRETSLAPERSRQFGLGSTTAAEMLKLFKLLHAGELVSGQASAAMKAHLLTCDDKQKFPKLLPEGTKLAFKTGSVEAARTAAGLMETPKGTVALCVLTAENEDKSWGEDNEGDLLCARIAREVYDHFNPPAKDSTEADGGGCEVELAEPVQAGRADSERSDGARENGEPAALVEPGVGEVQTVAGSTLKPLPAKDAADSLKGRPFTSCQVWAIANSKDGAVLWSSVGAGTAREVASTTKVMTALVALKMAEKEPSLQQHPVKQLSQGESVARLEVAARALDLVG
ncbi:MAG: serine hydrolase, partial [Planctomycetaceae bacterium]